MDPWLMIVYISVAVIVSLGGIFWRYAEAKPEHVERDRRIGAQLMLVAPIWPVALCYLIGARVPPALGALWRDATRQIED